MMRKSPDNLRLIFALSALALTLLTARPFSVAGAGQKNSGADNENGTPVFAAYRGVQIGMPADEARKKLGHLKEKDKSDAQDFFILSDNETAQILYDADKKVKTVSVDFMPGATDVPLAKAVVGADVAPRPDGSVFMLVRYPKAGYWVSYSKTAGNEATVSVTIQKIP